MQIGFYYYVDTENETEAGEQAAHFASLVRDKEPDCRPAMEFVIDGLDNATVNRLALAFLQRAEELSGFAMCVYTNAYNAGQCLQRCHHRLSRCGSRNTMWSVPPTSAPGPPGPDGSTTRPPACPASTATWTGTSLRTASSCPKRRPRRPTRPLPQRDALPSFDSRRTDRLHTGSLLPGPPQKTA